ncbi:MAG TPA: FIST N-terminal domain-containing protein [Steroidobacteraceae bacterium]|nr:FIST N-terminal domain-containing protein [Steroidobacteraceae bacterium]
MLRRSSPAKNSIRLLDSTAATEADAVEDLLTGGAITQDGLNVLFITTGYDLDRLARALTRRGIRRAIGAVTGCSFGPEGFLRHGITGFSLPSPRFTAVDILIENVDRFGLPDAQEVARAARDKLKKLHPETPHAQFGLIMVDAEACCEERLVAALGMEFAGTPLVGGSAGDVYFNPAAHPQGSKRLLYQGRALRNAAIFCLVASDSPVMALSHNHYRAGTRKVVITEADPDRRMVLEINGRPALAEFAAACGFRRPPKQVNQYAAYPLMIRVGGQYFARGVQRVHEDNTIEFACAIEAGVVAAIGQPDDMLGRLEDTFAEFARHVGTPELTIGFDCAARTVCMEQGGLTEAIEKVFASNRVVGFSALGEQFNTVHVNNSFTALAIGSGR